jgi:hypothetical protein
VHAKHLIFKFIRSLGQTFVLGSEISKFSIEVFHEKNNLLVQPEFSRFRRFFRSSVRPGGETLGLTWL